MLRVDFYEQYNNLFPNLFFKTMTFCQIYPDLGAPIDRTSLMTER